MYFSNINNSFLKKLYISTKEDTFSPLSLFVQDISNIYEQMLVKLGMIGHLLRTNQLDFGDDPDVFVRPGSLLEDIFVLSHGAQPHQPHSYGYRPGYRNIKGGGTPTGIKIGGLGINSHQKVHSN